MLDHVSLGVKDLERSRRFYDAALYPLGLVRTVDFQGRGSDYGAIFHGVPCAARGRPLILILGANSVSVQRFGVPVTLGR